MKTIASSLRTVGLRVAKRDKHAPRALTLHAPRWGRAAFWIATFLLCFGSAVLAADEKPKPQEPKVNPLEITTPDPLLPKRPKDGTLSPEDQSKLRASLDELNAQATALLQAGKAPEAFEIWYRELRLRRVLGYVEEVRALGRVGETAWQRNQSYDVQVITKRLLAIQKEAEEKKAVNPPLLQALGQAYQQVQALEPAVNIYQQILADQQARSDTDGEEETLKTLAQLNVAWLNYPKAATVYEELLTRSQARGDRVNELVYLQQLADIYDKAKQPQNALQTKKRLEESYLNQKDYTKLPALKIAIASDYEALNQPEQASQNYQEAYSLAYSSQQFAYATDALQKLAELYRSHNQADYALQVYQVLLQVGQRSYNFYALMNAYDQMGQIYVQQKNYPQALTSFQKGLELAKTLQYQETYFTNQIEQVNQKSSP